jgi:hypothetical protein
MKRSCSSSGQASAQCGDQHKKLRSHPCAEKFKKLQEASFPQEICALPHVLEMLNDLLLAPEEAIVMAVKRREQQWLNYLLEKFHRIVSDVLLHSASCGDEETVAALLPSMYDPGSDELIDGASNMLEQAVDRASTSGHSAIVRLLLPEVVKTGNCCYITWTVLETAARKGHVDIVAFAADFADGDNGDETSINSLLCAIYYHHEAAATFLVNRYYRDWRLEEALEKAIIHGLTAVADCIYEAMLKEDCRASLEDAFFYMAGSSLSNALTYLYRRGQDDSNLVGYALSSAARSGGIDMLTLLLDTGKVSTDAFDVAFWNAACRGRIEIVTFLSSNILASARLFAYAFESARESKVSQYLYEKLQHPAESTRTAFRNAVAYAEPRYVFTPVLDYNQMALVKFLASTGHVAAELITEAFRAASTSHRFNVVLALCDDPSISLHMKYDAFRQAAEAGLAQVLTLLSDKVHVPLHIKSEALKTAAQRAKLEALRTLCEIEIGPSVF